MFNRDGKTGLLQRATTAVEHNLPRLMLGENSQQEEASSTLTNHSIFSVRPTTAEGRHSSPGTTLESVLAHSDLLSSTQQAEVGNNAQEAVEAFAATQNTHTPAAPGAGS